METINLDSDGTTELLRTMFHRRNLVLVCGAGFTRGAKAKAGTVPSAIDLKQIMLGILKDNVGDDALALSTLSFPEIAEHFLNPEFVPTETVKQILTSLFTRVVLPQQQKNFLRCPWPYIYTFNIDDGVESNSEYKTKVLPNRKLATDFKSTIPCVFKIHGDATEELLYDEPSKIIFSTGQYVRSLTRNQSMLNAIRTDLVENNVMFVGCSLDNEIDLLYALAEYQGMFPEGRRSIYVTTNAPSRFQAAKLKQHGVNTILLVDDYDDFYRRVSKVGQGESDGTEEIASALLTPTSISALGQDRRTNQGYLLQDSALADLDKVPYYYAQRDIEPALIRATETYPITLLRGRRFSGKTLMLRHITQSARAKNVYMFSSRATVTEETAAGLILVKNGLLIFDANVLSPGVAYTFGKEMQRLEDNGTSIIVAANRTEPDISGTLSRFVPEQADFDLDNRLSPSELSNLNSKLDDLGLLRFEENRSLLDNTFRLIKQYQATTSILTVRRPMSDDEMELMLVIAVADKAHSSLATALGIRADHVFDFCERFAPILDRTETSRSEFRDTGSRFKIIANSKLGLAYQIAHAVKANGYNWLSSRLEAVVGKLLMLPRYRQIANAMFMFDSINYVLTQASTGGERTGFRPVVRQVYESLQPLLNDSPDYWLQRAKATLNVDDDEMSLISGIEFALKAYSEADRTRTMDNAEFSIALLYGKLCAVTKHKNPRYVASAIEWFSRAVQNYHRNPDYVQRIFNETRERRGWFSQLCDHLEGPVTDPLLLPLKGDIQYLITARRGWR